MRAATYTVPAITGDKPGTECIVYFFGPGQGGPVDANIERWKGQFTGPGGKPATGTLTKRVIHGLPATSLDISGNYAGMAGAAGSGYRMVGVVLENPGGNLFIKFTGPAKTVAASLPKFESMLASFDKAGK